MGRSDAVEGCTRFLTAGERVDVEQLNETCPKSGGSEDLNGKPRVRGKRTSPTWSTADHAEFTYPTSTVGGGICFGDLKTQSVDAEVSRAWRLSRRVRRHQADEVRLQRASASTSAPRDQALISFGSDGTALPPASPPRRTAVTIGASCHGRGGRAGSSEDRSRYQGQDHQGQVRGSERRPGRRGADAPRRAGRRHSLVRRQERERSRKGPFDSLES